MNDGLLVLGVRFSVELLALGGDVAPQATLPADGACTLDLETDLVCWRSGRWEVEVLARHIGGAIILDGKQVDGLGVMKSGSHDGQGKSSANAVVFKRSYAITCAVDKTNVRRWDQRCTQHVESGVDEMEERQRKRRGQHSLDGRSGVYHDDRDCLRWSVKCVWEQETSK